MENSKLSGVYPTVFEDWSEESDIAAADVAIVRAAVED